MVHALIARHYQYGGFYPVGGASEIAKTIIPVIQAGGGDVLTYADVKEILFEKGKAVVVRMVDILDIRALLVFSNAGVINTFVRLMPVSEAERILYLCSRQHFKQLMLHMCL